MSATATAGANDPASGMSDAQEVLDALTFDGDVKEVFLLIDFISGRSEKSLKDLDTSDIELPAEQTGAPPLPPPPAATTPSPTSPPIGAAPAPIVSPPVGAQMAPAGAAPVPPAPASPPIGAAPAPIASPPASPPGGAQMAPAGAAPVPPPPAAPPAPPVTQRANSAKPTISDVLYRLCQIGYPPHPDPITKAHKAAFVLMLKDRLNALAMPARGVTIAYTTMFVAATYGGPLRIFRRMGGTTPPPSSRGDLARGSYPTLETHARRFAWCFRNFPWLMIFVLGLTASAYWDVGFGRTIVQRIDQLDQQRQALLHPDVKLPAGAVALDETVCLAKPAPPPDQAQACAPLIHIVNQLNDSRQDLYNFAKAVSGDECGNLVVRVLTWFRPVSWGFAFNCQEATTDRPEATVAWVLSLFSTYVLPAMFGFLGTMAAIMRAIQAKVRDSLLGPRDFPLSILGLVIGPVAGLAVGLFYTPSGAATTGTTGLAGAVSLSASGLGFLAGYGADAFFKFIDALLIRVFALEQPGK